MPETYYIYSRQHSEQSALFGEREIAQFELRTLVYEIVDENGRTHYSRQHSEQSALFSDNEIVQFGLRTVINEIVDENGRTHYYTCATINPNWRSVYQWPDAVLVYTKTT